MTPSTHFQDASDIATVATAGIAFLALVLALAQIYVSRRESRLGTARSIYREYLAMAFNNPEMSSASYPISSPSYRKFERDQQAFESYEFYVSHLLFAAETILELSRNQEKWRGVLKDQFRYHALYLQSAAFPREHYDDVLLALVDEAVANYRGEVG